MADEAPAPATPAAPAPEAPAAPPAPPEPDSIISTEKPAPLAPPPDTYVNPDGTFVQDWSQKLPEEFADARVSLARYKSVGELIKAYRHAEGLIGKKGVIPPTAESSPEQVSEYRKVMGVPEKPEAYAEAIKPDIKLPDGIQWSDEIAQQYFNLAHRHNIPASAMKELAQLNLKQREFEMRAQIGQIEEGKRNGLASLQQYWGPNFENNIRLAKRAAHTVEVDPNTYGFGDPEVVKAFVKLASKLGEGSLTSGASMPQSTGDYAAKAKDIQTNKDNQYYKRYWDGDPDIQNMVRELHRKAAGGR